VTKPLCKCAWIRSDKLEGKQCPFGLPITLGCRNAGDSVARMCPLSAVPEEQRPQVDKANKRVYIHEKTGQRCIYAHDIIEKKEAVNCDFGDVGEGMSTPAFEGSPLYAQTFSGIGLDGLYAFPLGFYADNNESRNLFQGLFSLLGEDAPAIVKQAVAEKDEALWKKIQDEDVLLPEEQDRLNRILEECREEFEQARTDPAKARQLAEKWNPRRSMYPDRRR